ncbi:MAG: hypothetical protein ABIL70_07820 [candidate division WOR-3 bacterium]
MLTFFLITTIGFEYLLVDPIAGRGGMGYGLGGDGYSLFYNPAGLALNGGNYYSISYLNYIGGTHFGYLGLEKKQLGLGVRYFNSGRIKKTNAQGEELGYFSTNFIDFNLGKGIIISDFLIGGAMKLVYEKIDTLYSCGIGCDIGVLYFFLTENIQAGFTLKNIGTTIKPFIEEKERLPYELDLGVVRKFNSGWLGVDLVKPGLLNFGVRIGCEYELTSIFGLKVTYTSLLSQIKQQTGMDFLTGINVGFEIKKAPLVINYMYTPYFSLGQGHRITLKLGG